MVSDGLVDSVRDVFGEHLAKGLDTVLDDIVLKTTKSLFPVTLKAALNAASQEHSKTQSSIPDAPLVVAVRAARAASRTAARCAIFSTLLDLAMGAHGAGNAAVNAFVEKASVSSILSRKQRTFMKDDIEKCSREVRENVI